MFIDIDKFKTVNASYGVVVGDSLLLTVARRIQRHLEPDETLARIGGDRFAILLLKERPAQDLAGLAERVRRSLRSPIKLAGQEIVLTGSVGIAIFDGHQADDRELLREAETAMYRAKRGGADRIEIFRPEMRQHTDERAVVEAEIRKAVEKNQIRVLYQPIVYMPMEELAGFEALVRWDHPKHGLINPFGYLEGDGSADLLTRTVTAALGQALKDCGHWQKELTRIDNPLFVNFNLPPALKIDQTTAQDIRQALARHNVAKGSLKLGVPETMVMSNPEHAGESLEWLRSAGAELVLDDFCTGYSSLLYLGRLPFECVRIDRMLLDGSGGADRSGSGMLRAVTAMTHELGRKVIVLGVETDEDVGYLRSIECEYGQGFYYGDPISERDVLQLLKLVRKSERRMQPRGLFRAAARKQRAEEVADAVPAGMDAMPSAGSGAAAGAMAASGSGLGGPPPVPDRTGSADPTTEPLRRGGLPKSHVRPRGPMPAAAAAPPPRSVPEPAAVPFGRAPMPPPMPAAVQGPSAPPAGYAPIPPVPPPFVIPGAPMPFGHSGAGLTRSYPDHVSVGPIPPLPVEPVVVPIGEPVNRPADAATAAPPQHLAQQPAAVKRTPQPVRPLPNYDKLPPNIAASLQRLAGAPPSKPDSDAAE